MYRRLSTVSVFLCLVVGVLMRPTPASAQSTELFFSEYIEGTSNNKALEIFNGTGAPVNLAAGGYNVQMHFNGSPAAGLTINLTGTVTAGDVYVLAQASANAAILAQADQVNTSGWFNGDDAVVLRKGTTVIDVIGQIGFDPGTEWGAGLTSTADNTLRRQLSVSEGDTNGSDAFVPANQWIGFATDTFGGLGCHTAAASCPVPPPPPAMLTHIWEIQGNGLASPLVGERWRTTGIVSAVFPTGFFIQAPAPGDGNPDTSDGLFVFLGAQPTVKTGDEVEATGTVVEFFQMTELDVHDGDPIDVKGTGHPIADPVTFNASTPSPNQPQSATEMERFEGMLVQVVDGVVSSPTNQFGEASVVATSARPFREPGILFPGLPDRPDLPVWDGNPEIFEIDTDLYDPVPHLKMPAGATVTAVGPLAFSFSDYQIWPTALEVTGAPAAVPVRERAPGEFTVGGQNFLRLFDLVDDPATSDETPTPALYDLRLNKLSLYVRHSLHAPDVLAVQEVENLVALQDVADRIRLDDPSIVYSTYLEEGNDIGGIDVGFLVRDTVRVDSIEQLGKDTIFTFPGAADAPLNDRPPLVLRGAYTHGGALFPITVINVHQRSLSGVEAPDGRVRAKRHAQALELSQFIDALQDAQPEVRLVVIGDFNAFEFTDGYVDVMGQVTGNPDPAGALLPATDEISQALTNQTFNMPADQRYSFVFDGTAQSLDHAITSQGLDPFVRGAQHARGNADTPFAYDQVAGTALRSSDHDGTVLFLTADLDSDSVPDNLDACADTRIPESVPTVGLNPNHYALVDGDGVFDTTAPPGRSGRMPSFSIADTSGCSCEQILDRVATLEAGQQNFGCSPGTIKDWVETH
jgi:predicted extracellular nuclease